ncbi:MAG: SDR family NAD(P)-dependent oxidoreductase [Pseudomonadota bacterium]
MNELSGKVVIVTGAAGNLGQAVAQALGRAGAQRVLADRSSDRLAKLYPTTGAEPLLIGDTDFTREEAVAQMVKTALGRFGRIDALVNTIGGFTGGKPVHEDDLDSWDRMLAINLRTTLLACRAVIPAMIAQGSGRIVNVGARAALGGVAGLGAYVAAKSAVIRLTETLAAELKDRQITVNCVLPGTIDTPQNRRDMPNADHSRWVPPAAIADVIVFLVSDAARAVSGASVPVYGRS